MLPVSLPASVADVTEPAIDEPRRPRTSARRFWWWLGAAIALGLALRFAYALHYKWDQPVGGDAFYYHWQARLIARGEWFVGPHEFAAFGRLRGHAEHPPLFTLFLTIPSFLGFKTFHQHMIASCILGSSTIAVIGLAGRRIAGPIVGIVAAFLAAVYAHLWLNDALVVSETIARRRASRAAIRASYSIRSSARPHSHLSMSSGCAAT